MNNSRYSLIIPSWYPTREQPLNGIFIKKHVQLISSFIPCKVLYATAVNNSSEQEAGIEEATTGKVSEVTVYYKPSRIRFLNQLYQLYALWRGYRYILKQYGKPAVVHNHVVFPAGYFALFVAARLKLPLLITEHWSGYTKADGRYARLSFLHHHLTKKAFARAKSVSVVSTFLKEAIAGLGLLNNSSKVYITSNVLNEGTEDIMLRNFSARHPKALSIGNLNDHEKNVSGILDACALVVKRYPEFTITIVGGGNAKQQFEAKAQQLGLLNTAVFFTGAVPNHTLGNYYKAADFFVLNSNFETFNIAAAEALLHGLPVVSTRCGGPEEFINETNGILTELNNAAKLAEAIMQMIENYQRYDRKLISLKMKQHYSNAVITEQFKKMYSLA
jgi:glycosyltransferase involved in cell wall biosynthesis